MAKEAVINAGKNSLPFVIASILCGYANDSIPSVFPEGDLRSWAYRSIPLFSILVLFIIRIIKDLGEMSVSQIVHNGICSPLEKKRLKRIIDDTYASDEKKAAARARYNELIQAEMDIGARLVNYVMPWFNTAPKTPNLPSDNSKEK